MGGLDGKLFCLKKSGCSARFIFSLLMWAFLNTWAHTLFSLDSLKKKGRKS
jgi:hypothetical protein